MNMNYINLFRLASLRYYELWIIMNYIYEWSNWKPYWRIDSRSEIQEDQTSTRLEFVSWMMIYQKIHPNCYYLLMLSQFDDETVDIFVYIVVLLCQSQPSSSLHIRRIVTYLALATWHQQFREQNREHYGSTNFNIEIWTLKNCLLTRGSLFIKSQAWEFKVLKELMLCIRIWFESQRRELKGALKSIGYVDGWNFESWVLRSEQRKAEAKPCLTSLEWLTVAIPLLETGER